MNDDGFPRDIDAPEETPALDSALPPRLRGQRGREGDLVRRYLQRSHAAPEDRAWRRLEGAVLTDGATRAPRRLRWAVAAACAGVLAVGLWWMGKGTTPGGAPATTAAAPAIAAGTPSDAAVTATATAPATAIAGSAAVDPAPAAIVVAIDAHPRALPPGNWAWAGEASIKIGPSGQARAARAAGGAPTITLTAGRAALEVVHKPRPAPFRLVAGPYTFTVLGTAFTVERDATAISLSVTQGRVAVSRARRTLAVITAGGFWTGGLTATAPGNTTEAPPAPGSAPAPMTAEPEPCGGRASGQAAPARLSCWRAQAARGGLRAEVALYRVGTIARDELHDPAAALAAFEELRRRYPDGTLRTEADLSIVGLLASTGRYAAALTESADLLGRRGASERAAELHVLRGNVYREGLGDLARAADEYRLALDQHGEKTGRPATADEALFLHAVTLEALGRRSDAVERYRQYLSRAHPDQAHERAHEQEARQRLQRLSPP